MDSVFWLQVAVVLLCIAIGGRLGGVGLGATGGLGVCLLVLGFGLPPGSPPISVLLIIIAVISCTSILQGSGGLDLLVHWADRLLRACPRAITFTGPLVSALFVMLAGTAYVAFAIYPVIAEVATSVKVRPERPLSASVICAGIGVMASPMSAAMAAMVGIMSVYQIPFWQILAVTIPTYVLACLCAALSVYRRGRELEEDHEFVRRVNSGEFTWLGQSHSTQVGGDHRKALTGVVIFIAGILIAILLGSIPGARPSWIDGTGRTVLLSIPNLIQMVMLATGFFIIIACRIPPYKFADGSVFRAGLIGVVGVFGIAWCTGTFLDAHTAVISNAFTYIAQQTPFLFCFAAFAVSTIVFSPTVTTTIMIPLGLKCGLPPEFLIGTWACCFGDFIIPGGAQIGCTAFDRTGTTHLGSFVINHSYLRPGLVFVTCGTLIGWLISRVVF